MGSYSRTTTSGLLSSSQQKSFLPMSASLSSISNSGHLTTNLNFSRKSCSRLNEISKEARKNFLKITPLKLKSQRKAITSQENVHINDRYIPSRGNSNFEMSYHLIHSSMPPSNETNYSDNNNNNADVSSVLKKNAPVDLVKQKLIADTCDGVSAKSKILNLHAKSHSSLQENPVIEAMKATYSTSSSLYTSMLNKSAPRYIDTMPEKILDAPEFRNDYYLNLLDWSVDNIVAVALDRDVYAWNAATGDISCLFYIEEGYDYVTSLAWIEGRGDVLAVGNSKNVVELWDAEECACIRQMKSHKSRVGVLAWNAHLLASGSQSGEIHLHDVRVSQDHVSTLRMHEGEVCALKWSGDGRYLASGANDNLAVVWDGYQLRVGENSGPLHMLRGHRSAVKGLAWCPWQTHILATGGGTKDRKIRIWNNQDGSLVSTHDAKSQISSLLWSENYREMITSHGYDKNQLTIWRYPDMSKVCDLSGHTDRVLGMAMSPDQQRVASVGADETLRIWNCFTNDKLKKKKDLVLERPSLYSLSCQSIR